MIRLEQLSKSFETAQGEVQAVQNVSLEVQAGEICVFLGPSGCGKTTTLKMINRLIEPNSGRILLDGRDSSTINPIRLRRSIGYVIQQVGLFPNKTIAENICVVPAMLGWDRRKARARAAELLEMVSLDPRSFMDRYPHELSGGQQQRVGVLRALAADPPLMLMDEPFGAIDPINRAVIQDEFLRMQENLKKTIILVSHDLDEAIKMADRIAIFKSGRLEQYATPSKLLSRPANRFVREFLGADRTLKRLSVISTSSVMRRDIPKVAPEEPLARASSLAKGGEDAAAVCLDSRRRPIGVIPDLAAAAGERTAAAIMQPARPLLDAKSSLRTSVSLMLAEGAAVAPCVDEEGRFVGLLSWREIIGAMAEGEGSS